MVAKGILKIFLINFLFLNISAKLNNQEVFLQANNLYKQGNFAKAYELYKKIPEPGPKINYNLGNCAYKLKDYGHAMLYWKRAEKNWGIFNRSDLLENINLLKDKIYDRKTSQNGFLSTFAFCKRYFLSLLRSAPLFGVQILFLLLWIICFIYIRFLFKKNKKTLIYVLFFLVMSFAGLFVLRYRLDLKHYAIVLSKRAEILSGPGESFQVLGVLPQTAQIRVKSVSDNYYKIKFQHLIGWVNQKDVEKI